jgi:hypothetical protein
VDFEKWFMIQKERERVRKEVMDRAERRLLLRKLGNKWRNLKHREWKKVIREKELNGEHMSLIKHMIRRGSIVTGDDKIMKKFQSKQPEIDESIENTNDKWFDF